MYVRFRNIPKMLRFYDIFSGIHTAISQSGVPFMGHFGWKMNLIISDNEHNYIIAACLGPTYLKYLSTKCFPSQFFYLFCVETFTGVRTLQTYVWLDFTSTCITNLTWWKLLWHIFQHPYPHWWKTKTVFLIFNNMTKFM